MNYILAAITKLHCNSLGTGGVISVLPSPSPLVVFGTRSDDNTSPEERAFLKCECDCVYLTRGVCEGCLRTGPMRYVKSGLRPWDWGMKYTQEYYIVKYSYIYQ